MNGLIVTSLLLAGCTPKAVPKTNMNTQYTTEEPVKDNKFIIYQIMVRLFGNKNTTNKHYGSREENGVGKFNDITDKALSEIKALGVSHIWYTGVIEHATMTDYSAYGIQPDDPDIVKGIAGSPYAIKDYYDVAPDLAIEVKNRMTEFEALVRRTHQHQLKVIIDFVPNHVARTYNSDAKPAVVIDFGANDDKTKAFHPQNDFYYIPGHSFVVPAGTNAGGDAFTSSLKDGRFDENPAKATGNDVFSATPSLNDWSETIKLNYGVDYLDNRRTYFDPIPPVWEKMRGILVFWAKKDVDGFRCDMAEMVPVEFWNWVIPAVKKVNPNIIFIAEAYNPQEYHKYFTIGQFDFLYDKVGLYDGLKRLIRDEPNAHVNNITYVWSQESRGFSSRMVRFLENHDEERIASAGFAGNPWLAKPAMVVSATLSSGPVMIYFGQEVGEPGRGNEGFGGEDNRTTIFDYWGVPEHQKWMNNGQFDGGGLSEGQKNLRAFYQKLLTTTAHNQAIRSGKFYELAHLPGFSHKQYAYLRFTEQQRVLVIANFDRHQELKSTIHLPQDLFETLQISGKKSVTFKNILTGGSFFITDIQAGIPVNVLPADAWLLEF
ncbi:alpha-amylase family protein [Adhaeribacter radiodurans]|uniref:Alpha-amylase n=1 Tax=Adhaeribacter radiodurans TaxID=2745197 RepID=A0A7L7LCL8_9BACT|nr:alpha-amylase family protein [Adhaeribacter radiodurans]QMU30119.1 alpha-amylase [Adhaeribacter radiodurans]